MQRIEIHIDGWPRPDWTVYQEACTNGNMSHDMMCALQTLQELEGSWISVALGPVDEAVDAAARLKLLLRHGGMDTC